MGQEVLVGYGINDLVMVGKCGVNITYGTYIGKRLNNNNIALWVMITVGL